MPATCLWCHVLNVNEYFTQLVSIHTIYKGHAGEAHTAFIAHGKDPTNPQDSLGIVLDGQPLVPHQFAASF